MKSLRFFLAALGSVVLLAGCPNAFQGSQNDDCSSDADCDSGQQCIHLGGDRRMSCQIACTRETLGDWSPECPQQECMNFSTDADPALFCYPNAW